MLLHLLFSFLWNFFSRVVFFYHPLTTASSSDNRDMSIVSSSPTWAISTCFFPVGHDPWPFDQLYGWIWGCPGLSRALLNQGAQNKADCVSYALGIGMVWLSAHQCEPGSHTWVLSCEKENALMSLIYSGSLGTCPKIAIGLLAQSILSD